MSENSDGGIIIVIFFMFALLAVAVSSFINFAKMRPLGNNQVIESVYHFDYCNVENSKNHEWLLIHTIENKYFQVPRDLYFKNRYFDLNDFSNEMWKGDEFKVLIIKSGVYNFLIENHPDLVALATGRRTYLSLEKFNAFEEKQRWFEFGRGLILGLLLLFFLVIGYGDYARKKRRRREKSATNGQTAASAKIDTGTFS